MNKSKVIGIFGTEISSRIQGNLYKEIHEKAIGKGYHLAIFSGTYDKVDFKSTTAETHKLFALAENMEFAAFVIHAQSIDNLNFIQYLIDLGKQKQIPVFVYDCDTLGVTGGNGVITINPNYKQGFAESVKHLIEYHHCTNIFMLGGMRNNRYSDDRIGVYRQEMTAHGIAYDERQIGYGDFWEIPAADAVNQFLDSDLPTPQAISCANDSMAITAIKVLEQRGVKVPDDVLITGFDGIEDGKYGYPKISTCEPDLETVSEFIFRYLEGQEDATEFLIPLRFYPKESCGCNSGDDLEDRREITRLIENFRLTSWQHHMIATMQFELIDSSVLDNMSGFMHGILDVLKGYSHLFCIRDDIETRTDYTQEFERMRIFLNKDFLPPKEYESYSVRDIFPDLKQVLADLGPEEMLLFTLIHGGDKKYGYYAVKTSNFASNELKLLSQVAESATIVIESTLRNMRLNQATQQLSEMYERMSEIYIRDTMTGLYNRHGYYRDLEDFIHRDDLKEGYVHILSIDMDDMKYINDHFGHLEGDHAIKAVATAINECFSQPCICARFGGDEFAVALFTETKEGPSTERLSWKLNRYLENMPMLAGKNYSVGVSVGMAVSKVSDVADFKQIEKLADDSMYRDKRERKGE